MQGTEGHWWHLMELEDKEVNEPEMGSLMLLSPPIMWSGYMWQNLHLVLLHALIPVSMFRLVVV